MQCDQWVQSFSGTILRKSRSTLVGSECFVKPNRYDTRLQCVSTIIPGLPKPSPISRLAVLRPIPGRFTSVSKSPGISPPCFSSSAAHNARMFLALFLKKPADRISFSSVACGVFAQSLADVYFLKSGGVMTLTRLSVHCAERIAAMANGHRHPSQSG